MHYFSHLATSSFHDRMCVLPTYAFRTMAMANMLHLLTGGWPTINKLAFQPRPIEKPQIHRFCRRYSLPANMNINSVAGLAVHTLAVRMCGRQM